MTATTGGAEYPPEVAAVRPGEDLDWDAAERYLRAHIDGLGPLRGVGQFPNGAANLTYLLEFEDRGLVLRRPPFGRIAIGAHDMKREFRALGRLWRHFDRAPRAYLVCEDHEVVGADFVVSEYRPGQVIWGTAPPSMAHHGDLGRRVGFAVIEALADLHRLDPVTCEVGDLGRPDGFLDRQLAGWQQRWEAASEGEGLPLMADVGAQLAATKPSSGPAAIVHNDYKVDNCQFDPQDPDRVRSIFDWDMATLGDPLVDLGTTLNYWPDPSDTDDDRPVYPEGLDTLGLPTRAEVVDRYAERSGREVGEVSWYEAFACWKTGVVLQQLSARYRRGETTDERQASKADGVASQARRAVAILERG